MSALSDTYPSLLGQGDTSLVYQLTDSLVIKKARKGENKKANHANEQEIFQYLQHYLPIPYLIQCFYHIPDFTFLEFAPRRSLAIILGEQQQRDMENSRGIRVISVKNLPDQEDTRRWMSQLCSAAAGLQAVGLAHGNIRPRKILLDGEMNVKLAGFERSVRWGADLKLVSEPFGRLLNKDEHEKFETYGQAGTRTETFALGSTYYSLLHGFEPCEDVYWDLEHFAVLRKKFQNKEFPSNEDAIISKCWNGDYTSINELLKEFQGKPEQLKFLMTDNEHLRARHSECEAIIRGRVLDKLNTGL